MQAWNQGHVKASILPLYYLSAPQTKVLLGRERKRWETGAIVQHGRAFVLHVIDLG